MRVAAWVFAVCVLGCLVGVMIPAVMLDVGAAPVVQPTSISYFRLATSKDAARRFIDDYRGSRTRKVGVKVLRKVAPHLRGQVRADVADVQSTLDTLDQIRDEDIETVGTISTATMWTLLGLHLVVAALIFGVTVHTSRVRLAGAVVAALLAGALALAIHVALRRIVAAANDEVGRALFSLRAGAYLIPVASVVAACAILALIVAHTRARR